MESLLGTFFHDKSFGLFHSFGQLTLAFQNLQDVAQFKDFKVDQHTSDSWDIFFALDDALHHREKDFSEVRSLLFLIQFGEVAQIISNVSNIGKLLLGLNLLLLRIGLLTITLETFRGQVSASTGGRHHSRVHGHHERHHVRHLGHIGHLGHVRDGTLVHHHLHLFEHRHGVHHRLHSGTHAVKLLILGLGHMEVDVDLVVSVKSFDLLRGLGSHEASKGRFFGLEIDETHQGLIFDILGVTDLAVLDLAEHSKSFFEISLGDGLLQVAGKNVGFVFIILIQVFQLTYAVGFLLGPVDVNGASLVERVSVLEVFMSSRSFIVVFKANKGENSFSRIRFGEHRSHFSIFFTNLF